MNLIIRETPKFKNTKLKLKELVKCWKNFTFLNFERKKFQIYNSLFDIGFSVGIGLVGHIKLMCHIDSADQNWFSR